MPRVDGKDDVVGPAELCDTARPRSMLVRGRDDEEADWGLKLAVVGVAATARWAVP